MQPSSKKRHPRIFLSYASADREVVEHVAEALRDKGVADMWLDTWQLALGDVISERIDSALRTADIFILFLSPSSLSSNWVQKELSGALAREMEDRAITIITVLVRDCPIPSSLEYRRFVDLRNDTEDGIRRLVDYLTLSPSLDGLLEIKPQAFEHLVRDLLLDLGFASVDRTDLTRDFGYDFSATHASRDPFGGERTETWLVEVKAYRHQRVDIATIRSMIGLLMAQPAATKGLLVTNGQLTSVARKFLSSPAAQMRELRIIDGAELSDLLLHRPALVRRYFPTVPGS